MRLSQCPVTRPTRHIRGTIRGACQATVMGGLVNLRKLMRGVWALARRSKEWVGEGAKLVFNVTVHVWFRGS